MLRPLRGASAAVVLAALLAGPTAVLADPYPILDKASELWIKSFRYAVNKLEPGRQARLARSIAQRTTKLTARANQWGGGDQQQLLAAVRCVTEAAVDSAILPLNVQDQALKQLQRLTRRGLPAQGGFVFTQDGTGTSLALTKGGQRIAISRPAREPWRVTVVKNGIINRQKLVYVANTHQPSLEQGWPFQVDVENKLHLPFQRNIPLDDFDFGEVKAATRSGQRVGCGMEFPVP